MPARDKPKPTTILVCDNLRPFGGEPSCAFRGSRELAVFLKQEIEDRGLDITVAFIKCFGQCRRGPNLRLLGREFVHEASIEKIRHLLDRLSGEAGETVD